ncbi:ATP-binding protein [Paenibacillaceae bacterium WGS1546]|uniref:hybrid sensor histidine kinase/response regulator n=1 Tax=Cohnella sp. WGS1546 TaxID=3366810 RepID=UPI00372D6390
MMSKQDHGYLDFHHIYRAGIAVSKLRIATYLLIFVLALTGVRLAWLQLQASPGNAEVSGGVLDLRNWKQDQSPLLLLNGEWHFYPNELVDPAAEAVAGQKLATLPSTWGEDFPKSFGYASYRLRLLWNPTDTGSYSIRIPSIPSSSALYVNGERLAGSGVPAERAEDYIADNVPYTGTFVSDRDLVDIVLHVANYDNHALSGIMQPIKFGTEEAIRKAYSISTGVQAAMFLLLFMHAAYAIALFVMGTRHKALLSFILLMFSAMMSIANDDDRILQDWFEIDYLWGWKLYYLSFLGISTFLLKFTKDLLPSFERLAIYTRWFTAVCAIYAVCVLALPPDILSYSDAFHTLLTLIPFFLVPWYAYRAIRQGDRDMIYILFGMTALSTNILWGAAKTAGWVESDFYPFDLLAAFSVFAMYWFKGYFRNFEKATKLARQLQAADKQKDEFLVNTSHELRNPLHGMLNMAQAVMDSGGKVDRGNNRMRMELLISVGKRLSILLDDLADLKRFEENRVRIHPVNVHLSAVTAGALDMIRYMIEGKPIRLESEVPALLPPVYADENRLIQILFNLLHNAVKFTDEGVVRVHAFDKDGQVHIKVSDTGIGMDRQTMSRIFLPYEQGSVAESGKVGGLGLGLAITKQLVELQGGSLSVESTPGQGSVFTFTLPIAVVKNPIPDDLNEENSAISMTASESQSLVAAAALPEFERNVGDRARILAVDDDPVNLRVLQSILPSKSYELVTAVGGEEALALLKHGTWDLLIADVMMPRMSGYELTRFVREDFSLTELPILLLTARSRKEDIEAGFRVGANDYVTKPVDSQELKSRVRALTDVARAARVQARMEAAWLQAQIRPHFLFNAINSIFALSEIDINRMHSLLRAFEDYLRASFDFQNADQLVPLEKELELVRAYLYIEKARFEDRIHIEWDTNDHPELFIPPLTIQPLVENAVRHGLLARRKGGKLSIAVADSGIYTVVSVSDDGVGMDEETIRQALQKERDGTRRGVGLYNTNYRLKQLYGEGLRIQSIPGQGTTVSFTVRK